VEQKQKFSVSPGVWGKGKQADGVHLRHDILVSALHWIHSGRNAMDPVLF